MDDEPETDGRLPFREFVRTEATLTEERKALLIDIYASWDL